jgi:hypothetical protein
VQEMVNEGVRRAYANADNPLRASVLADPAGARRNTKDNTPAVVHYEIVPGDHVEVICAADGRTCIREAGDLEQWPRFRGTDTALTVNGVCVRLVGHHVQQGRQFPDFLQQEHLGSRRRRTASRAVCHSAAVSGSKGSTGSPACWSRRLPWILSMPTAEPQTPAPT